MLLNVVYVDLTTCLHLILIEKIIYKTKLCHACYLHLQNLIKYCAEHGAKHVEYKKYYNTILLCPDPSNSLMFV